MGRCDLNLPGRNEVERRQNTPEMEPLNEEKLFREKEGRRLEDTYGD
jgi:hypothetical protein